MSLRNRLSALLLVFALLAPAPVSAAPARPCKLVEAKASLPTHPDTTIELEQEMSPELMNLLTTTDGTIRPILSSYGFTVAPPEWLVDWARKKGKDLVHLLEVPWEELDYLQKRKLIDDVSRTRQADWYRNRTIPGLRVKDVVELNFVRLTRFLGKNYAKGRHRVDIAGVFGKVVEYAMPEDARHLDRVELHFRSGHGSAGDVSFEAKAFQKAAGLPVTYQHAHLVGRFPFGQDPARPFNFSRMAVLQGVLFAMRAQHLAEATSVVEDLLPIREKRGEEGLTIFGAMEAEDLPELASYFENSWKYREGRPASQKIEDRFKIAYVGIHGEGKYDRYVLWGLQVRVIRAKSKQRVMKPLLDNLQRCLQEHHCWERVERVDRWLEHFGLTKRSWKPFLERIHYNRDWDSLLRDARPELSDHVRWARGWLARQSQDTTQRRGNLEVKMLFHDWELDPLYFDQPELLAKIRVEQDKALKAIRARKSIPKTVATFLKETGIYEAVRKSMGYEPSAP